MKETSLKPVIEKKNLKIYFQSSMKNFITVNFKPQLSLLARTQQRVLMAGVPLGRHGATANRKRS